MPLPSKDLRFLLVFAKLLIEVLHVRIIPVEGMHVFYTKNCDAQKSLV